MIHQRCKKQCKSFKPLQLSDSNLHSLKKVNETASLFSVLPKSEKEDKEQFLNMKMSKLVFK